MEQVTVYKTSDGKFFESESDGKSHEVELYNNNILKIKENYVRDQLKESCYGYLFAHEYAARKYTNLSPDNPLVHVIIKNSDLVKKILNHLDTIK